MRHTIDIGHGALQQVGRQTFTGPRAQQFELFAATHQVATPIGQLVARGGIGLVQLLQAVADLIQILNKQHELVVQPTRPLCNLPRILALSLLLPQAVDHPQCRQQRGRADDHDIAIKRLLKQVRLSLQSGGKSRFYRDEQQHKVQAVQPFEALIVFTGQPFDVVTQ